MVAHLLHLRRGSSLLHRLITVRSSALCVFERKDSYILWSSKSTIVRRAITGGFTIDATEKQFSRAWNGGVNCVEIHPSKNVGERFVLVGTVDGSVVVYDAMYTQGPVFTSNRRFGSRRRAAGNARRRNDDDDDDDNASAENGSARHPLVQTSEGHDKSVSSVAWYPEDR